WIFGPAGGMPPDPEKALYASLGELPPGHPHLATGAVTPIGPTPPSGSPDTRPREYTPTMWPAGAVASGPAGSCFAPMIVDLRSSAARSAGPLEAFDRGLAAAGGSGPKAEFGRRLNHMIAPASFDPDFDHAGPAMTADTKVKAAAKAAAAGAPLALMAVIDDGLPFAHPKVRSGDGRPRFECCWLQSAPAAARKADRTVLFGRELTRKGIEALMRAHPGDEDAIYRAAGQFGAGSSMRGSVSHGAMVLDLAAGGRPGDPLASEEDLDRLRLIGVQLPSPAVMDTVGFGKDAFVLAAFHYVFERADRIESAYGLGPLPLVINFSFGFTAGPHDGSDRLEEAINTLVAARRATGRATRLVMPAGNHFAARLHGVIDAANADGGTFDLKWRCQPDDKTANYLEVWYPTDVWSGGMIADAPDAVEIAAPDGSVVWRSSDTPSATYADPPQRYWDIRKGGAIIAQLSVDRHRSSRWRLMLITSPTASRTGRGPVAPAGLWRVKLNVSGLGDGRIDCRIQRDTNPQHPELGARQSYFDEPRDRQVDGSGHPLQSDDAAFFVRCFDTLNGLSTHGAVDVVAGYVGASAGIWSPGQRPAPARYCSAGPGDGVSPGDSGTVDLAAPSDAASGLQGIRGAGTRGAAVSRLSGTSAAAPQIARAIALDLLHPGSMAGKMRDVTDTALKPRLGARYLAS
ncbi:MAG: hypothetical protein ACRCTI_07485, partial [Beijerinckiaceae bacterium]